ncbi:TIGR04222 domain-containing membrane protein [Streptomyces sp. NPDC101132]|uniref:TIGR04222 domain-containing membrane protein n=1 Tax=Streptomyces sp. NPDC101132 TaxID=3366110 RepID=UPI0037F6B61F
MWITYFAVAALLQAVLCVRHLRAYRRLHPQPARPRPESPPTVYEFAYLKGGPSRVAETAIGALFLTGRVTVTAPRWLEIASDPRPGDPVQCAAVDSRGKGSATRRAGRALHGVTGDVARSAAVAAVADRLVAQGLAQDQKALPAARSAAGLHAAALVATALLGIAAVTHEALSRRPAVLPVVAFTTLLVAGTVVAAMSAPLRGSHPTHRGRLWLQRYGIHTVTPDPGMVRVSTDVLSLAAVALAGLVTMRGLSALFASETPVAHTSAAADGSSGGGGGGCGGGDGGGGGCGSSCGGGCGGCGG